MLIQIIPRKYEKKTTLCCLIMAVQKSAGFNWMAIHNVAAATSWNQIYIYEKNSKIHNKSNSFKVK